MSEESLSFRAARATRDDGRLFARYLDEAAEGFFRFMLGRRMEEILAKAFVDRDHDLSYQNVTFAERDGAVVGMVSGYTAERHRRASDRPLREAAGRLNPTFVVVSTLFAPLLRIIDTVADGDFYLQAIAVDEGVRGQGVGTALMDFIEAHARVTGSRRLSLDVAAGNECARKIYANRGMTVESQWPRRLAIPKMSFLRMAKEL